MSSQGDYPIGIFDSGFGGLTILKQLKKSLPRYNYLYFGDSKNTPYGNKTKKEIYNLTCHAIDFFVSKNCHFIILACNTASANALRKIQKYYLPKHHPNTKVLGVTIPISEFSIQNINSKNIGILATRATVKSKTFPKEIKKLNPNLNIFQLSAPKLVTLIESGQHNTDISKTILAKYLKTLEKRKIDTLILGCTHYELLSNQIQKLTNSKLNIVSSPIVVANKLKDYLKRHPEIEHNLAKNSQISINTSGDPEKFQRLGSIFFETKIKVQKVKLT